jgi:hypothetical protein
MKSIFVEDSKANADQKRQKISRRPVMCFNICNADSCTTQQTKQSEDSISRPGEVLVSVPQSLILVNFTNPVVLRAVQIVERLLADSNFFVKTYGVVLNEIALHYKMPELSQEDIMNIQAKLLPCKLIKGLNCRDSAYMQCSPKLKHILVDERVRAFSLYVFRV